MTLGVPVEELALTAGRLAIRGMRAVTAASRSLFRPAIPVLEEQAANRGLTWALENPGEYEKLSAARRAAIDYESATTGAMTDIESQLRNVPALRFDNPNPDGMPFTKWDGIDRLGNGTTELIDAKMRIVPFSTHEGPFISDNVRTGLMNKSVALAQNPGYRGVIELPSVA